MTLNMSLNNQMERVVLYLANTFMHLSFSANSFFTTQFFAWLFIRSFKYALISFD